jgi:hypothetical protein
VSRVRPIVNCACCGKKGPLLGRRLIRACYAKHRRNGTLHQFPVDLDAQLRAAREAAPKGGEWRSQLSEGLIEDYAFCREQGETREMAALRVGVHERTARKYERMLREQVSA